MGVVIELHASTSKIEVRARDGVVAIVIEDGDDWQGIDLTADEAVRVAEMLRKGAARARRVGARK
jgi:hypothetical protein